MHPGPCVSRKYPICPIFSKVMLKFTENFSMTFAENRTYGAPEFAGTEVNRHSGKLKGLSGYLQNHHPTPAPVATLTTPTSIAQAHYHDTMVGAQTTTTRWLEHKQPRHDGRVVAQNHPCTSDKFTSCTTPAQGIHTHTDGKHVPSNYTHLVDSIPRRDLLRDR